MRAKVPTHQPVLLQEVLTALKPNSGGIYLDGTFGGGGHSRALLNASVPAGKVVAIDRDPSVEDWARVLKKENGGRFEFQAISYDQMATLNTKFDGIVLDLGLSSDQLEDADRGFSFQRVGPLDLRFNTTHGRSGAQFLSQASRLELEYIFREYAEDRFARRLAAKIADSRRLHPIRSTADFVALVGSTDPNVLAPLFQAIRIAVNDELYVLEQGLQATLNCLKRGGTLVVISFHSLEDRRVKQFFKSQPFELLTKKPIIPSEEEINSNRRSRSAKLRAGRFLG